MPKKRYNAEEIIHKLREADALLSQGKTVSDACKLLSRLLPTGLLGVRKYAYVALRSEADESTALSTAWTRSCTTSPQSPWSYATTDWRS